MEALKKVHLTDSERVYRAYPGQLSGGMLQRVTMAILLGLSPRYIFADEPTSALDEENKSYLIQELVRMKQQSAILFVSHDDAAIRTLCDELLVMQSGTIAERGTTGSLFASPREEWTKEFVRLCQVRGRRWLDMEPNRRYPCEQGFPGCLRQALFMPCVTFPLHGPKAKISA